MFSNMSVILWGGGGGSRDPTVALDRQKGGPFLAGGIWWKGVPPAPEGLVRKQACPTTVPHPQPRLGGGVPYPNNKRPPPPPRGRHASQY